MIADQAIDMQEGILSYRGVLEAERVRGRLFGHGEGAPQQVTPTPLDPEPQLTALRRLGAGDASEAGRLLDQAEEQRPARRGVINGIPFDDIRDADDVLAAVLEVLTQGHYGWIPYSQVKKLEFQEPKYFRDLLWMPTAVTLTSGFSSKMFIPARYPGSEASPDDQVKLGRATDWQDKGGVVQGIGQRAFLAGDELHYLVDVREIDFEDAGAGG